MKTVIATAYFENINPRVRELHREVVTKLMQDDYTYQPIKTNDHAKAMTTFTRSVMEQKSYDRIIWLDIDCIPLCREALTIDAPFWGCAQRANHIENNQHIYASPFAMGIELELYKAMGAPDFAETKRGDVGEELTYCAENIKYAPLLYQPLVVEEKPVGGYWQLINGRFFGLGTTYGYADKKPLFYHAFQIRHGTAVKRFERQCLNVFQS
jgi:hypothetical protein